MTRINDALECTICMLPYNEDERSPRLLSCGHTYCSSCLQNILKGSIISCPHDRSDTSVSDGVKSLKQNLALLSLLRDCIDLDKETSGTICDTCESAEAHLAESYCVDCKQTMCGEAKSHHSKFQLFKHHRIVAASIMKTIHSTRAPSFICTDHGKPYELYDRRCQCVLCVNCFFVNHCGHECQSLPDAAASCQQEVQQLCSQAKIVAAQAIASEERVSGVLRVLEQNYQEASRNLNEMFEQILTSVASRKDELSVTLKEVYERKVAVLQEQIERLRLTQTCLINAVDNNTTAGQVGEPAQILLAYCSISSILLKTDPDVIQQAPAETEDIKLLADKKDLIQAVTALGSIVDGPCDIQDNVASSHIDSCSGDDDGSNYEDAECENYMDGLDIPLTF